MRFACLALLGLISASALAYDYPVLENPVARELLERHKQDKSIFDQPAQFVVPNPAPAWPCNVPEIELYKVAGLSDAHPELRKELEKSMRKAFRDAGMSAKMLPQSTYSNIQIVPLKAQCAAGKLDGELQLLVSYDKRDESKVTIPFGNEVVTGTTVMTMHTITRSTRHFVQGEQSRASDTLSQMTMQSETHYDNAAMEAQQVKTTKDLGLNKPTTTRSITYTAQDGTIATFIEMEEPKVSGGLFGVSVEKIPSLMTTIMLPVDEHRMRSHTYKNKRLISTAGMKNNVAHGEQVMYMDNYLKPLNLRLDQQPGMENAREVTIDGVDLIEQRSCMQNGVQVKIVPCPGD